MSNAALIRDKCHEIVVAFHWVAAEFVRGARCIRS